MKQQSAEKWTLLDTWKVHSKYTELEEFNDRLVLSHISHQFKPLLFWVIGGLLLTWLLSWLLEPHVTLNCVKPEGVTYRAQETYTGLSVSPNGNPAPTVQQAHCQKSVYYSHPIMSFWNHKEVVGLSKISKFEVVEIVGDESDSYRLYMFSNMGRKEIFTASWESTAFKAVDQLADFLTDSDAEFVHVDYKSPFYYYFFFLPWAMFSMYVLFLGLMIRTHPKISSIVWVFDKKQEYCFLESHSLFFGRREVDRFPFRAVKDFYVEVVDEEDNPNQLNIYLETKNNKSYTMGRLPKLPTSASTLSTYKLVSKVEKFLGWV